MQNQEIFFEEVANLGCNNTWLGEYQMTNYYNNLLGTNTVYKTLDPALPFLKLYLKSPLCYNILFLLILGCFSGLLGAFVMSLSFWKRMHRITMFIPLFLILRGLSLVDARMLSAAIDSGNLYIDINIMDYLVPDMMNGRTGPFFICAAGLLVLFIALSIFYVVRRDMEGMQG